MAKQIAIDKNVSGFSGILMAGEGFPSHTHENGQLFFAQKGLALIGTPENRWAILPHQAVWIPPNTPHDVLAEDTLEMRTLYFGPDLSKELPNECSILQVSPLVRELILKLLDEKKEGISEVHKKKIMEVLFLELKTSKPDPFFLPIPQDPRLKKISDILVRDPSDQRSLNEFAQFAGGSGRTLARAFLRETGLTFGNWRKRLRVIQAIERLKQGESVTRTGLEVGYESTSAFIVMFKGLVGVPPGKYLQTLDKN